MKNFIIVILLIVVSTLTINYNKLNDNYLHLLQAIEEEIL